MEIETVKDLIKWLSKVEGETKVKVVEVKYHAIGHHIFKGEILFSPLNIKMIDTVNGQRLLFGPKQDLDPYL